MVADAAAVYSVQKIFRIEIIKGAGSQGAAAGTNIQCFW